jgi:hypothetical protein
MRDSKICAMSTSSRWLLRGLRWSYCVFIAAASIATAQSVLHGHVDDSHGPHWILALAITETIAIALLAIEPAELLGCAVLLAVFSIAGVVSLVSADWLAVLRFIYYAATAIYIVLTSRMNTVATHVDA